MKTPFDYNVSLRIFHPDLDPAEIIATLGLGSGFSWKDGEPRPFPAGSVNRETYRLFAIADQRSGDLVACLSKAADDLAPHAEFFHGLRQTGGRAEFSIWWTPIQSRGPNDDDGAILSAELLTRIGRLGIDLTMNVDELEVPPGSMSAATMQVSPEEKNLLSDAPADRYFPIDEEQLLSRAYRCAAGLAASSRQLRAFDTPMGRDPTGFLVNYLMTEFWDRGFSQTEIRNAFTDALTDMNRYAAGEERRR